MNVIDNQGFLQLELDQVTDIAQGSYVSIEGFSNLLYNRSWRVIKKEGEFLTLVCPYIIGESTGNLYKFSNNKTVIEDEVFTEEGNEYYAVNAKLPFRSPYGNNLVEYVCASNKKGKMITDFDNPVEFSGLVRDYTYVLDRDWETNILN